MSNEQGVGGFENDQKTELISERPYYKLLTLLRSGLPLKGDASDSRTFVRHGNLTDN